MDDSHRRRLRTDCGWTDEHVALNAQLRSERSVATLLHDGDEGRVWRHTFHLAERLAPQLPPRRSLAEPAVAGLTPEDIEELYTLLGLGVAPDAESGRAAPTPRWGTRNR